MDVPAAVVPYDPVWPALFDELRLRADAALAGVPHVTEHVGSTAVPGLAARPIVDLDVVVPDEAGAGPAIEALTAAGWRQEGDLGIAGRAAFRPPADAPYHHLYVVAAGHPAHRDHVDLRDYLRAHPGEAARYGELKRRLAVLLETGRVAYADGKAELITEFLRQARGGASHQDPARSETRETSELRTATIHRPQDEPPRNELPAALVPGITWRGAGITAAIPALLVYTTGVELLFLYRSQHEGPRGTEQVRATSAGLRGLTANGVPVTLLSGQHDEHGFTYRAWVPFRDSPPSATITFELEWPGIEPARHPVADLREAAAGAAILW